MFKFNLVTFVLTVSVITCSPAQITPHKMGSFETRFTERSPLSTLESFKDSESSSEFDAEDYVLSDQTFKVTVPESYKPNKPHGLFIWVSSGDNGTIPKSFKEVLTEEGFIFIGPNNVGNSKPLIDRFGMAIDAAHNMPKYYNIDPDRIIISGLSGGGRIASELAIMYPDVFTLGGYYVVGCNFWGEFTFTEKGKNYINNFFIKGGRKPKKLSVAKQNRFVFHTGEKDFNLTSTTLTYENYEKAGFKDCLLLVTPGMSHGTPGEESFRKGIQFMNAGLHEKGQKDFVEARRLIDQRQFSEAADLLYRAEAYGVPEATTWIEKMQTAANDQTLSATEAMASGKLTEADQQFSSIRNAFGDQMALEAKTQQEKLHNSPAYDDEKKAIDIFIKIQQGYKSQGPHKTVEYLERLITEYPETEAAVRAKEVIQALQPAP